MTLKYKVGDRVQVNSDAGFSAYSKGVVVEYTVPSGLAYPPNCVFVLRDGAANVCGFYPDELTLLKAAESSNESGSLVQKISVENDVVSSAVNTSDSQSKSQDSSWYENGDLPPVGAKCIYTGVDEDFAGVIVAHVEQGRDYQAIIQCEGDWWPGEAGEFRPWYSDEEIEAQEREKAIEKMREVCRSPEGPADAFEALYDAGLRFVEEGVE